MIKFLVFREGKNPLFSQGASFTLVSYYIYLGVYYCIIEHFGVLYMTGVVCGCITIIKATAVLCLLWMVP